MSDLSDEEFDSIERSLGGPGVVATVKSETCRMVAEIRRRRSEQSEDASIVDAVSRPTRNQVIDAVTNACTDHLGDFNDDGTFTPADLSEASVFGVVSDIATSAAGYLESSLSEPQLTPDDLATLRWLTETLTPGPALQSGRDPIIGAYLEKCGQARALIERLLATHGAKP